MITPTELATVTLGKVPTKKQVQSVTAIMREYYDAGYTSKSCLAYLLATTRWETAHTLLPVREYNWAGRWYAKIIEGQRYYGRGFVQVTHLANYQTFSKLLKVDLVRNPDLALEVNIAAKILVIGCMRGLFTGVALPRYLNASNQDWINARRVVNGLDKADIIAGYARKIYAALLA